MTNGLNRRRPYVDLSTAVGDPRVRECAGFGSSIFGRRLKRTPLPISQLRMHCKTKTYHDDEKQKVRDKFDGDREMCICIELLRIESTSSSAIVGGTRCCVPARR
jgi:hypothetical protein